MRKSTKWMIAFISMFLAILLLTGTFMVVVDPYFHYHKPLNGLGYSLENERYQNDGIVKHFSYDAIITGSSMTECFRPSEMKELFGLEAIKVPFSGGSFKEVNDNLRVATEHNPNIKMVVRCLDAMRYMDDKDYCDYTDYPTYLYDDNLLNDVNYLFNKSILLVAFQYCRNRNANLSFDNYANWSNYFSYGHDAVMERYGREELEKAEEMLPFTKEECKRLEENIQQNVIALAKENPQIDFYIYLSPYSIYCMDYWYLNGELERQLLAERRVIELLLPYKNIHLFSFNNVYDLICDGNNYKDPSHHSQEINSQILCWMKDGKYQLTEENYENYCEEVWDFYMNYNYEQLYQKE